MLNSKQFRENHAGTMALKNGKVVNYGVIRIVNDNLVYYTGKGLRELSETKKLTEEELYKMGNIAITPLSEIDTIIT